MFTAALSGFLLGLSLIVAIGAQNAFVLRQGLRREHVFAISLTCALSDALLIIVGVGGFSAATKVMPALADYMLWGGVAFLVVYGLMNLRAALKGGEALNPAENRATPLGQALATCLALTWFNPHVYLDTVVLLGSISAQYPGREWVFGAGAVIASFTFFFALAYGARLLSPLFARPNAWRVLDGIVAFTMFAIALKLATS
ncbi:MAG: LysE/ArgO family amino acid transporter [Brevirhabdus sp.]